MKLELMKPRHPFYRSTRQRSKREMCHRRRQLRRLAIESLEEKRLLAVFTVDSVSDLVDQNPGDGLCEVSTGGACTLRAAVMEVNALGGSAEVDQILIPAGAYVFALPGNGNLAGDLDITQSVILSGAGSASTIIDASGLDRVFDVQSGNVEIRGVTVRGGLVDDTEALLEGTGGGIRNEGTLLLADSVVTGNRATRGAGIGNYNGTLNVQRSVITGNGDAATLSGGGVENYSYYDPASLSLTDSTVSGNRASSGGGLSNHAYDGVASAVIAGSTISGNSAGDGGGIANRAVYYAEQGTAAVLTIVGSTLSGNVASGTGGGIHSQATMESAATLSIRNSTIAKNTATGGTGGGIHVIDSPGTNASLNSVLVGGNTAVGSGQDLAVDLLSATYTLIETAGGHGVVHGTDSNQVGVNALIAGLADNGGLTFTHALGSGSPAVDQGANEDGLYGDQRGSGYARTLDDTSVVNADDGTDVGAIEMGQVGAVFDFGDAPDSIIVGGVERFYPTLLASDGARHQVVTGGPKLGTVAADPEADAFPAANANGDDLVGFDDEDGLAMSTLTLTPGTPMDDMTLAHDAGTNGAFLNVWIDLNMDGDWSDLGEQILDDVLLSSGVSTTSLTGVTVPAEMPIGTTFLRARISTDSGLAPIGAASDGEVEDFELSVGNPPTQIADLSVANVVDNSEPELEDIVRFSVSVLNSGPVTATGIQISALLPFELFFDAALTSAGVYDDFDGVWILDQLLPGQTATLQIDAIVETTDPVFFTAEVVSSDQLDTDSAPGNGISSEDDQATAALGTCLAAAPLHPGMNSLRYVCASPGAFTGFVRGIERGTTHIPDYQVTVDIADAEQMAIGIADSNGIAEVLFQLDEVPLAEPMLVQAFEMFPAIQKANTLSLGETEQFLRAVNVGVGAATLQREVVQPSVMQALATWYAAGADPRALRNLAGVSVTIADLPGDVVARTSGRAIILDNDAAGNGWFVDASPWDQIEFGGVEGDGYATSGSASGRIDLLTTLTHEFGHLLGMDDSRDLHHVMHHMLGNGRRVLPAPQVQPVWDFDLSRDGRVTSMDALLVVNRLSQQVSFVPDGRYWNGQRDMDWAPFDTNRNGVVTAIDALTIINQVSLGHAGAGEAEQAADEHSVAATEEGNSLLDLVHAEINRKGAWQALSLEVGAVGLTAQRVLGEISPVELSSRNYPSMGQDDGVSKVSRGVASLFSRAISGRHSLFLEARALHVGLDSDLIFSSMLE